MELCELYVDPFFQGEGIGSAIIQAFCLHAKQQGCQMVWLWVLEQNQKARQFYEKLSFYDSGERRGEAENQEFFLLKYEKKLCEELK